MRSGAPLTRLIPIVRPPAQPVLVKTKVTRRRRLRVGLLGGSFNPAHAGHIHISNQALIRLQLDEVWWLVSPQNPLKSKSGHVFNG